MRSLENAAILRFDLDCAHVAANVSGQRALGNHDPFVLERLQHDLRHFRVVLGQGLVPFDHSNFAAHPDMRLRHFHADGSPADDQQMLGLFTQLEQGFVGLVGGLVQPGDRRHQGG